MPGAINNEDYSIIDVKNGVYVTHPLSVPDGYAYSLKNFMIKNGVIQQRLPVRSAPGQGNVSTADGWYHTTIGDFPIVELGLNVASGKVMRAGTVKPFPGGARPALVGILSGGGGVIGKNMPAATLTGGLVVYNSNLYAGAVAGVVKIGVTNFPTSVTETAIATSPANLVKLITHKSRLFGFARETNRLYFTDAPAVGTLPETWNPTVNFIDFNGPNGVTKIWDIVALNNYIYVFTDNGLFSVYTSGAPSNWIVKTVNPDISIYFFDQVVVKNNLIYFVAEDGVYVTDGFDFKLISQALSEVFSGSQEGIPSQNRLQPFDGGLLLKTQGVFFNSGSFVFYTKVDSIAWTNITFCEIPVIADGAPVGLFSLQSTEVVTGSGTISYLIIFHQSYPNTTNRAFVYEYVYPTGGGITVNSDVYINMNANDLGVGNTNRNIKLDIKTKEIVGSNFMRVKYFRDLIFMFSSEFPYLIDNLDCWYDGLNYATPLELVRQDTPTTSIPNTFVHGAIMQSYVKSGLNQSAYSFRLAVDITLQQIGSIPIVQDRFYFCLQAMGYTGQLERTAPRSQTQGQF